MLLKFFTNLVTTVIYLITNDSRIKPNIILCVNCIWLTFVSLNLVGICNLTFTELAKLNLRVNKMRSFMVESVAIINEVLWTHSARVCFLSCVLTHVIDETFFVKVFLCATFISTFKHLLFFFHIQILQGQASLSCFYLLLYNFLEFNYVCFN